MNRPKSTRALIFFMCALVITAVIIAKSYYSSNNNSIDPRIKGARELYKKYNLLAETAKYDSVFWLLDTIESIYSKHDHYKNSYEIGVLYNNRSALYLTQALNLEKNKKNIELMDSLFVLAENSSKKSITLYNAWLEKYKTDTTDKENISLGKDFFIGFEDMEKKLRNKILKQRLKEIEESLVETERRLSVSYTNLGVVYRHKKEYELAAQYYKEAIDLWDKNLTAENNLNILLGRPIKKRNLIQKIFPPERISN